MASPVPLNFKLFSRSSRRAEPFLIFALARTGSTTLRRLLACHPDVTCVHEPFNPGRRPAGAPVTDGATLRREVQALRRQHGGIKHVWDSAGWPFPTGSPLNLELLTMPGHRVLFLNRRNVLRRLVSFHVASQTDAWGMDDRERAAVQRHRFAPLDLEELGYFLAGERAEIARHREAMRESGTPFAELWYEDLFDPRRPLADKEATLAGIFGFLGLRPALPAARCSRVRGLFAPDDGPMNSAATYRRIPGIDEVEARFGSEATGYLFR